MGKSLVLSTNRKATLHVHVDAVPAEPAIEAVEAVEAVEATLNTEAVLAVKAVEAQEALPAMDEIDFEVFFKFPYMEDMLKNNSMVKRFAEGEEVPAGDVFQEIREYCYGWDKIDDEEGNPVEFCVDSAKAVMEILTQLDQIGDVMELMKGVSSKNSRTGAKR